MLDRPRKVTFVPLMEDPRDALDEMVELRQRKWSCVQQRQLCERESEREESVEYPPVRSFNMNHIFDKYIHV